MVCIINDQVHTRQADNLVELAAAFINVTPFGHERTNLEAGFLSLVWEVTANDGHGRLGEVRIDFLIDE